MGGSKFNLTTLIVAVVISVFLSVGISYSVISSSPWDRRALRDEPQLGFLAHRSAGWSGGVALWHEGQQAIILGGGDGTYASIWVSRDLGHSWEKVYTSTESAIGNINWGIVTRAGTAILAHQGVGQDVVVRSTDLETWERVVITDWGGWWHATEDDDGNIYAHTYRGQYGVRRTQDQGETWTFQGILPVDDHIHDLQYDPWGDRLIAATGDLEKLILSTTDLANLDPASWVTELDFDTEQVTAILLKSEEILLGSDIGNNNWIRRYKRDFSSYMTAVQLITSYPHTHTAIAHIWDLREAFPYVVAVTDDGQIYWIEDLTRWKRLYLGCSDLRWIADSPRYLLASGPEGVYMIPKESLSRIGQPMFRFGEMWINEEARSAANVWSRAIYKGTKQRDVTIEIVNGLDINVTITCHASRNEALSYAINLGNVTVDAGKREMLEVTTGLPYLRMTFLSTGATTGQLNVWALLDEE